MSYPLWVKSVIPATSKNRPCKQLLSYNGQCLKITTYNTCALCANLNKENGRSLYSVNVPKYRSQGHVPFFCNRIRRNMLFLFLRYTQKRSHMEPAIWQYIIRPNRKGLFAPLIAAFKTLNLYYLILQQYQELMEAFSAKKTMFPTFPGITVWATNFFFTCSGRKDIFSSGEVRV